MVMTPTSRQLDGKFLCGTPMFCLTPQRSQHEKFQNVLMSSWERWRPQADRSERHFSVSSFSVSSSRSLLVRSWCPAVPDPFCFFSFLRLLLLSLMMSLMMMPSAANDVDDRSNQKVNFHFYNKTKYAKWSCFVSNCNLPAVCWLCFPVFMNIWLRDFR